MRSKLEQGMVIGYITLISKFRHSNGKTYWNFECSGNGENCTKNGIKPLNQLADALRDNRKLSCGCRQLENYRRGENHYAYKGKGAINGGMFETMKRKGKERYFETRIDISYLDNLWAKQDGICPLTGEKLTILPIRQKSKQTASVDRISSSEEYIDGNLWFIHKRVNQMKRNLSLTMFLQYCFDISKIKGIVVSLENEKILEDGAIKKKKNYRTGKNHLNWTGGDFISGKFMNNIERHGREGLGYSVDVWQIEEIYLKQNGRCYLSGRELTPKTASLTRLDKKRGFEYDNVGWIHTDIKKMKTQFTDDEIRYWADKVANYTLVNCPPQVIINLLPQSS